MGQETVDTALDSGDANEAEGPTSPPQIPAEGWKATLKRTVAHVKGDRVPMIGGSIAYHGYLSLLPTVIALIGISQLIGLGTSNIQTLVHGIGKALPEGASNVLTTALQAAQHRTTAALTVTVIAIVVAGVVVLWFYLTGIAILVGAELKAELEKEGRVRGGATAGEATRKAA